MHREMPGLVVLVFSLVRQQHLKDFDEATRYMFGWIEICI